MALPQMHGRTHVPAGYSVLVEQADPENLTLATSSPDALPIKVAPTVSGGTIVEWVAYTSTTNWSGAGLTTLSFTETSSSYDTGTPTFNLSGGNIQVGKAGFYTAYLMPYNFSIPVSAEILVDMRFNRSAGTTPGSYRPMTGWTTLFALENSNTQNPTYQPMETLFFSYAAGMSTTTFEMKCQKFKNGALDADVDVIVNVGIARIGDQFA